MRRRIIAVLVAVSVVAGFATVPRPAMAASLVARFDWSMPDRIRTHSSGVVTNLTPSPAYISPATWRVKLNACVSPTATAVANHHWAVTVPGGVREFDYPGYPYCEATFDFPAEGTYHVALTVTDRYGQSASTARWVTVEDILILSLGDSLASGEGSPDFMFASGPPQWGDRRCHRSGWSGPAQAAKRLERADPRTSVTFVSLACSGAGILTGLIHGYWGREPGGATQPLTSQIEAASRLLCPPDRTCSSKWDLSQVDALMLQVGANDVHFGDIVFDCAFPAFWVRDPCHTNDDTIMRLYRDLAALPGRLDQLNQVMEAWLRYSAVLFPDYFDPTRGDNGDICPEMRFVAPGSPDGHVSRAEASWAHDAVVVPLNARIIEAAFRHGWQSLDFITDRYATHGYCADDRWIVRYDESFAWQGDKFGTMHPNRRGQNVYADRLLLALQTMYPPAAAS